MTREMRVRDAMTAPVVTASPSATLEEVAQPMLPKRVGCVVIVDADDRERPVGIVTETDFDVTDDPIPFTFSHWPKLFGKYVWSEESLEEMYALALPLAFEAKEPDLMRRPPRRPDAPILSRFLLARTALVAALMTAGAVGLFLWEYYLEIDRGVAPATALAEAQTMAVTTVILFQIFYLLNCRSLRDSVLAIGLWTNPTVYLGIGTLLVLQLGFVYLPFMQDLFGSAGLAAGAWMAALAVSLVVLPVIAVEKRLRQRPRPATGR